MAKPQKRTLSRLLFKLLFLTPLILVLEVPVFLAGAALGTYLIISKDLPEIPALASYQPRTVSTFFADDGTVIGVFWKEKRFVVELSQIPPHVVNAFLAAEDARFFSHTGVDWTGIARAMARNLQAGRITQGGSTITMQVTRNFLLTRERTFSRKVKELILASRLEKAWGKEKILHIYLNEIYLGEGSYGVEAAARGYFGKPVEHLSVGEAAMIAGLVASPARYNPFKSEELAVQRQLTVLGRMLRAGFLTDDEYNRIKEEKLVFRKDAIRPFDLVPDFAEAVRRYIVKKYGEEKLYNEGLKVFTTCRVDYQLKAQESLDKGLKEIRARQKNLAIINTIPWEEISGLLHKRSTPNLTDGKIYQGVVMKVTRKKKEAELSVALSSKLRGLVKLEEAQSSAYKVGHVLALRFDKFVDDTAVFTLDDNPTLQGALVCIENRTGYVRAIVGGASDEHFKFNRAIQAKLQPGSAFKPVIYSVALEEKSYSPATIIVDEPIVVDLDRADEAWEPRNAGGDFLGPLSFRRALELSRNICTIKILMDAGFDPVIKMARRMGITAALGENMSLSLGTSEMSLFELASAYTVFPNSGIHVEPIMVKRIEDRFGNVLEDNTDLPLLDPSEIPRPRPREEIRELVANAGYGGQTGDEEQDSTVVERPERSDPKASSSSPDEAPDGAEEQPNHKRVRAAMSPQTAYIMTTIMQGGVRQGTGARMTQYLKRNDLAGKTGTTNKAADAWFIGFNPDLTTGVWVGFDEKRPLGRREEGGRAALPIWGYFMRSVLENKPEREFPVPPDITFKEMITYTGNPREGFVPKPTREPVYSPFSGLTLVLSPMDTPESLAEYRGIALGVSPFHTGTPGSPIIGPYQTAAPPGIYPVQPGNPVPLHPIDGRPAPGPSQPVRGTGVPQSGPTWNSGSTPPGRGPAPISDPRGYPPAGPVQQPGPLRGDPRSVPPPAAIPNQDVRGRAQPVQSPFSQQVR